MNTYMVRVELFVAANSESEACEEAYGELNYLAGLDSPVQNAEIETTATLIPPEENDPDE